MAEEVNTPYAVFCYGDPEIGHMGCGRVFMTREQYMHQMSRPDSTWRCPNCNFEADFDDDNYDEEMGKLLDGLEA